ncbi:hypothetical protein [Sphingobacterium yanglingense]|uniref:Uncharacterized protein n=1 Tax=Sphingobacterium yanglingense TaxID=1437280 RepID=A0A4R6WBV6_9SPHI|nr:hypothetical protein [Sphingobacterium yanglingense]TDQ77009.1 hypothetical protein CLV99_2402 [Sphingobacterium yanglingense]
MALIPRETELQEGLTAIFDHLLLKKEGVKKELVRTRKDFNKACDHHIKNGFQSEQEWVNANICHQNKFIEYEMYCHIIDILNDFKDIYGQFPEYIEMHRTLNQIMIKLAQDEKYELAAIAKLWVDKIESTIQEYSYC